MHARVLASYASRARDVSDSPGTWTMTAECSRRSAREQSTIVFRSHPQRAAREGSARVLRPCLCKVVLLSDVRLPPRSAAEQGP